MIPMIQANQKTTSNQIVVIDVDASAVEAISSLSDATLKQLLGHGSLAAKAALLGRGVIKFET